MANSRDTIAFIKESGLIAINRQNLSTALLWIEGLLLFVICVAFWHHSPPIRDNWIGLLLFAPPIFGLRWLLHGRLWRSTPLIWLMLALIPLTLWNFETAPFARADYLVLASRPIFGIWLVIYCLEVAPRLWPLLLMSSGAGLTLSLLALNASQWTSKSDWAMPLLERLPRLNHRAVLPDMLLSFNVNEIAGALAWICPLLFALVRYPGDALADRLIRGLSMAGASLSLLALILGQSRFAIMGVLIALVLLVWLTGPSMRWRWPALAGLLMLGIFQGMLLLNLFETSLFNPDTGDTAPALSSRDTESTSIRLEIWDRAWQMLRDEPLTGVGMSMYRSAVGLPQYEIASYAAINSRPPHAHNEWLQIASDLGLPGLLLFISWQAAAALMLWRAWQTVQPAFQVLAAGLAAGLAAHAIYGVGDAITLWDRYAFIFWWMMGMVAALHESRRHIKATKAQI